ITWQYLSAEEQEAVSAGIDALAARAHPRAPFTHLMLEPYRRAPDAAVGFMLRARSWPGDDDELLADCSPHGPPVTWT
ncbi:MAG: DUF2332 family protein, partial [Mycobacterium sp.]|nr:DUF2332 family protein [Mycobacterium sp.]